MATMRVVYLNTDRIGTGFAWVHRHPCIAFAVSGLTAGILAGTVIVMLPVLIIFALDMNLSKTVMIQVFNRLPVVPDQGIAIKEKEESTNIVFGSIDPPMANSPVSGWTLCRHDSGALH